MMPPNVSEHKLSVFERAREIATSGLSTKSTIKLMKSITDPNEEQRFYLVTLWNRRKKTCFTDGWHLYVDKSSTDEQAITKHFAFKQRVFEGNIALMHWVRTDEVTCEDTSANVLALGFIGLVKCDRSFIYRLFNFWRY